MMKFVPLKRVASLNDEALDDSTPSEVEVTYADISDVSQGRPVRWKEPMAFGVAPSRARRQIRHGDVLVSTVRTYLRAVTRVVEPPMNAVVSTGFAVVRPKTVDSRFLGYALQSDDFVDQVVSRSVGVSYPAIAPSDIASIKIPVPQVDEQRAIADYLDHETAEIDAFIADLERSAELRQERSAASLERTMREVVTEFPMRKIGWDFVVGNGSTPKSDRADFWEQGDIPWVNSSVVNDWVAERPSKFITRVATKECHLPIIPAGSVLVGLTGQGKTRGKATILGIDSTINQHMAFISPRARDAVSTEFLRYALVAQYELLRFISDAGGSTKGALTCADLVNVRIPAPPIDVQERLVRELDDERANLRDALADIDRAISLAKERRAALISGAVTGQVQVEGKQQQVGHQIREAG